ncbi:hypothetical protein Tco_0194663 [Tanacetum coccineum]
MLEKHLYDSWKSRMKLYMMNRPHGRMILASVEKGPLVWPSITVDGLPKEIYALVSQHRVAKDLWEKIKLLMQGTSLTKQERESSTYPSPQYGSPYQSQQYSTHQSSTPFSVTYPSNDFQSSIHHNVYSPSSSIPQLEYPPQINQQSELSQQDFGLIVLVFQKGDDPIDVINHMMSFLTKVVTSCYQLYQEYSWRMSNLGNQLTILIMMELHYNQFKEDKILLLRVTSRTYTQEQVEASLEKKDGYLLNANGKATLSDNHYILKVKAHRMSISQCCLSSCCFDDMELIVDDSIAKVALYGGLFSLWTEEPEMHTIPISTNLENKSVNDTLTVELKRYKEQVKVLKEGQNGDLRSKDNISDTCAQSVEIDLLKQTLSEHLKEKQSLLQMSKNSVNSSEPTLSIRPTNVEVPKELPKVSMHSKLNVNSELLCVKWNGCMLSDNHDLCVLDFINNVNAHAKSRSVKKKFKRES